MPPFSTTPPAHYYGNIVRRIFLGNAILMLISLPLEGDILPTNFFIIVLSALILTLLAGFTSPQKRWILIGDVITASAAFILFELAAVQTFGTMRTAVAPIFFLQQILAIAFLVALYFSSKTLRGTSKANLGE